MKRLMNLLCLGVLTSALGVACDKQLTGGGIEPDPLMDCWIFVTTIPGEETVLLAQSGVSFDEAYAIYDDFKSEYVVDNVLLSGDIPVEERANKYQDYNILHPEATPDCYEITMTIEFDKSSVPSVKALLGYGFRAVRIDENIAVCKWYDWAFTDEMADRLIEYYEGSYNAHGKSKYTGKATKGTITGISTVKKLGPEVHDMPVIF